jgi:diguanylate cyclase (GGDEF)-like protein/PAS domain S-box-containing protein
MPTPPLLARSSATPVAPGWLHAVFAHPALGIALVDMQGRFVESNPALQRMIGYSEAELRGMTLDRITHGEDLPRDRALLRELLRGQRNEYQVENRYLCNDGRTVWGHLSVSLLRNDQGEPSHALAMVQDVTDRRRAEATVADSEAKFRALIENASDLVSVLGADGTILYESPSVERVLGYTPDELVGRSVFELVHPEDLEGIRATFQNVLLSTGEKLSYELRYRHKAGHWITLHGVGANLLHDPAVGGIVANSRDVSERKEAEESLKLERAHLEQLFESSPEGVVLVDMDDRVLRVNSEFTRLFGYSAAEAVGRTIPELLLTDAGDGEALSITQRIARGERVRTDGVRRRKDGSVVEVSVTGAPVLLGDDRIAVYGIYQDNTDRKSLERALRRMSTTDVLTGLLNRRGFESLAEREWIRARRTRQELLLFYIDLDGFKQVNDVHGHGEGDRLLQEVADLLRGAFRASDVIARAGGDEFVILTVDGGRNTEVVIQERLRAAIAAFNRRSEHEYALAMSIGAHRAAAEAAASLHELLAEADRRMYEQKRQRRQAKADAVAEPFTAP